MSEASLRVVHDGAPPSAPGVREFFRVARLVPADQDVVSIPPGTKVRDALALMSEHGFSQLPVVTASGTVIGVFTYRSLAAGLTHVRRNDDALDASVDDMLEDLPFVRASDEVGEILRHLELHGAVLIGEETNVVAVATSSDVTTFLWEATRPFVLLQDIELAVRDLIRSACPSSDELSRRIAMGFDDEANAPANLEELSLGQLQSVLLHGENFGQCFRQTFGANRDLVYSQLEPVREIRNKVFHFRDDVTADDLNTLVTARRWLQRKVLAVQSR